MKKKSRKAARASAPTQRSFGMSGDPATSRVFGPGYLGLSNAGVSVDPVSALTAAPVWAAVRAISEDLAKMPLLVERRLSNGGWVYADGHPLTSLLTRPNRWQTRFDFVSAMAVSISMRGNAYAVIVRDFAGSPIALIPVSPDRVQVSLAPSSGRLFYSVSHPLVDGGNQISLSADDILHVRSLCQPGSYIGMSPIQYAAETIGLTLATQQHGARLFSQGAQVNGVLKTEGELSDEAAARAAKSWRDAYTGLQNSHKVVVLEGGMSFEPISLTNEEAQFLSTREFQVTDVARIFRVPPHKLMDLSKAHYANLEASESAYVNDTLLPLTIRFEEECDKLLYSHEQGSIRLRFDFDRLTRPEQGLRYAAYRTALESGWLNRNEVRAREGLSPIAGGDEYRISVQTLAADQAGDQPNNDPQTNAGDDEITE